jgi:probable phosphoglycerate mutase
LDEISWGSQEGVPFNPYTAGLYEETVKSWQNGDLNVGVGGGETPIEVMDRQKPAMKHILSEKKDPVLICMHGRAMRIMLCWLLNYPLSMMDEFLHQNLGMYKLTYSGNFFKVDLFNETGHLLDAKAI